LEPTNQTSGLSVNPVKTVDELRRSIFFRESQWYYPPGIDKYTDDIDVKSVDNVINPESYVPHFSLAISGAIDMSER
jgi:hypothetical protein